MDLHDREMIRFAKRWRPYGGGDDDIFPEFGIPVSAFYRRLLALLNQYRWIELSRLEQQALREFCMLKLDGHGGSEPSVTE